VSPVKYEMGFYIPEDDILHSHRRENFKSYIERTNGYQGVEQEGGVRPLYLWDPTEYVFPTFI
jgi:hypothetical protein